MASEQTFPIQRTWRRDENGERKPGVGPSLIPWSIIAPHERQAQQNHSQTLHRLAERGGLCACEACAVLEDRPWHRFENHEDAERRLIELVERDDAC